MSFRQLVAAQFLLLLVTCSFGFAEERVWKDKSGFYRVKGELVAYNDKTIVLERGKSELLSMEIKDLSDEDKEYLKKLKAEEKKDGGGDSAKTWTMQSGLKVKGTVLEFARREVKFQLEDGKIYINDKLFQNLPPIYQQMAPRIVAAYEKIRVEGEDGLKKFLIAEPNAEKTYTCDGVLFQLSNGDRYNVPFFFFSEEDQKAMKPAWDKWVAAKEDKEKKEQESFYLRAQADAAKKENEARMRQIAEVRLQLQAYDAGLFDLWEVGLYPRNGRPLSVIVPGRNSDQAAAAALSMYPGSRVGPIAKIRRRR